ncbi:HEPN domain-containing protein [bacterium]|nr:HEPN domain-containing protein [bacterium]
MDEPKPQKDLLAEEWVAKGNDDELNALSILKHQDGTPTGVVFLCHQMAEKFLKAYIVHTQKKYPKSHNLGELVEMCANASSSFGTLGDAAAFLDPLYIPSRYPGDYPEFMWDVAERAYKTAALVKEFVLDKLYSDFE